MQKLELAQCESILASTKDANVGINATLNKAMYLLEYGNEQQAVTILEKVLDMIGSNQKVPEIGIAKNGNRLHAPCRTK